MAEISDALLERMIDRLGEISDQGVSIGKKLEKIVGERKSGKSAGGKDLDSALSSLNKFSKKLQEGTVDAKDLDSSIRTLERTVNSANGGYKKAIAEEKLSELKRKAQFVKASDESISAFKDVGKSFGSGIKQNFKSLTSSFSDSTAGFELSGEIMKTAASTIGGAGSAAGQALSTFSTGLMMGPHPAMKALGVAGVVAGQALGGLSEATKQLASAGIDILVKQSNALLKSFYDISGSGVTLAGGMTELGVAAAEARLSQAEMAEIVRSNGQLMADSGTSVTGALKQMTKFGKAFAESGFQDQLMGLGFSIKEQSEMLLQVVADANRVGKTLDDASAKAAVKEYAKNLRVIADITGEDAKKRMEEAQATMDEFAFNQKLQRITETMDPKQADLFIESVKATLAAMPKELARGAVQKFVGGAITRQESFVTGQIEGQNQLADLIARGKVITAEEKARVLATGKRGFERAGAVGGAVSAGAILGVGDVATLAQAFTETGKEYRRKPDENIKRAEEAATAALETLPENLDPIGKKFLEAQKNMIAMNNEIQKIALDGMPLLGAATSELTGVMRKAVGAIRDLLPEGITTPSADTKLRGTDEYKQWFNEKMQSGDVGFFDKFMGNTFGTSYGSKGGAFSPDAFRREKGITDTAKIIDKVSKVDIPSLKDASTLAQVQQAGEKLRELEKIALSEKMDQVKDAVSQMVNTKDEGKSDKQSSAGFNEMTLALTEILYINKDNRDLLEKIAMHTA